MQPATAAGRDHFAPEVPASLSTAINYFLACCAARRARGHSGEHMTMLVHTSAYIVAHERVAASIENWVASMRPTICDPASEAFERMYINASLTGKSTDSVPPTT